MLWIKKNFLKEAIVLLLILIFWGCQKKENESEASIPFRLSDSLAAMIHIDTVKTTGILGNLNLTGKVTFNEDKVIKIFPPVAGVATEVRAELGDYVEKGKVLAVIRSSDIASYEQQRIAAEANLQIAKKNLDASEDMHTSGVSSEKDLITAQREYAKAEAEEKRIHEIFKIYDIGDGSASGYEVKAPISGFIVERKINKGTQLRPDNADNLFTISNLDEVWVTANIYESEISKVKAGYDADITTLSYEGKIFKGKVDRISNVLDPETKVMQVRIRMANPGYLLKPGMFASVFLHFHEDGQMTEVPAQAVIFDKSKNFVMVYRGRSDIETREIELYKTVSGKTYVKSGIKDGEKIISQYHMLVYDEINGG